MITLPGEQLLHLPEVSRHGDQRIFLGFVLERDPALVTAVAQELREATEVCLALATAGAVYVGLERTGIWRRPGGARSGHGGKARGSGELEKSASSEGMSDRIHGGFRLNDLLGNRERRALRFVEQVTGPLKV